MSDTVKTFVIANTDTHYAVNFVGLSDGTGESLALKIDKSTLLASDGAEPASLDIQQVWWAIQGHIDVSLWWDHSTDDLAKIMPAGIGYFDLRGRGDIGPQRIEGFGCRDPRSSGGTGDILLTSTATSGASYDIILVVYKNPN